MSNKFVQDTPFSFITFDKPTPEYEAALKAAIAKIPNQTSQDAALQALDEVNMKTVYSLLTDNFVPIPSCK